MCAWNERVSLPDARAGGDCCPVELQLPLADLRLWSAALQAVRRISTSITVVALRSCYEWSHNIPIRGHPSFFKQLIQSSPCGSKENFVLVELGNAREMHV